MIKRLVAAVFVSALTVAGLSAPAEAAPKAPVAKGIDWDSPGKGAVQYGIDWD